MRYFNLGKKPGTIQGGKVPLFYNNMEGVYQDPFGRQDEEDAALHNPEEDEELAELAQQYEEEEDEDYIFNREVLGALQEAGIDQEDWEYWMDEFLPTRLGENYTVDQLDEFLENRRRFDEKMARDNERYDLKRKRDEDDDSDYDDDFMNYGGGEPTGNGIGGALSNDHPARRAGLEGDLIYGTPLDEMDDEDTIMDPSGRAVYRRDDILRHIESQHENRHAASMAGRPVPAMTWPTRIPMTLQHVRDIANRRPTRQPRGRTIPLEGLTDEELEDLQQLYDWIGDRY